MSYAKPLTPTFRKEINDSINKQLIELNFSTSFRDDEMNAAQESGLNHLLDMFTAIKQQVLLKRALSENKKMR